MSGHSKWSSIKRQKGAADVKRGAVFTKLSNAISLAVRQGGNVTDPNQNFKLRLAIDAAKVANMPKETIKRAIDRVINKEMNDVDEVVYEGFGPGGISVIIEAVTDNKNRTTSEVKNIFDKNGGAMGQPGSVSYQFKQMGEIIIHKNGKSFDDIFLSAVDLGAEDVEEVGEDVCVYTPIAALASIKDALEKKGYTIMQAELTRKPLTFIEIAGDKTDSILAFLDKFEALEDVQKTYSNVSLRLA